MCPAKQEIVLFNHWLKTEPRCHEILHWYTVYGYGSEKMILSVGFRDSKDQYYVGTVVHYSASDTFRTFVSKL